jgi:UV DNA damage endonuclease
MIVRFGYVAMSVQLRNASPSRTMTMSTFARLPDREAGLRRLEQIARDNLQQTLRLLKHNRYMDVHVYRFTSKLIPLATHDLLQDWNPYPALADAFAEVGAFVRAHGMRVSFHPDHYTVLNTPRRDVFVRSVRDLEHHVTMLEWMGLDARATCNIHVGGTYGDKPAAGARFVRQFAELPPRIAGRMTLENDDKTFTAAETLALCEQVGVPMVLDLHHHALNNPQGDDAALLWPRIVGTWEKRYRDSLPPKIHMSSPKSATDPRSHADDVDPAPLLAFLLRIAPVTPAVDVMLEAKRKDEALFRLMDELHRLEAAGGPIRLRDGATIEVQVRKDSLLQSHPK